MGRRSDDNEALVWLVVIVLGIISIWFYLKVQASAAWLNVDVSTAFSMVGRTVAVTVGLGLSMFLGWFRKVLPYVPAALLIIMLPALTYWSWAYVQPGVPIPMNSEPEWYGATWAQVTSVCGLIVGGFLFQQWWDNN